MDWMSRVMQTAAIERSEWLEDVIAGLMCAGVKKDEIEIDVTDAPEFRTTVRVRGEVKYEYPLGLNV